MAYTGAVTAGNNDDQTGIGGSVPAAGKSSASGPKKLFTHKNPGAPGKLGKSGASTRSESLSKLRGKGALA